MGYNRVNLVLNLVQVLVVSFGDLKRLVNALFSINLVKLREEVGIIGSLLSLLSEVLVGEIHQRDDLLLIGAGNRGIDSDLG